MRTLRYNRLPLVEVAARVTLGTELPLSPSFLVDLADVVKPRFPEVVDIAALESPPGQQVGLRIEPIATIPGFAFRNEGGVNLHVQRELLIVRWTGELNQEGIPEPPYPGFRDSLLPSTEFLIRSIESLLGEGSVKLRVANMSYVNLIREPSAPTGALLSSLLQGFDLPQMARTDRFHSLQFSYRRADSVDVRYSAQTVDSADSEGASYTLTNAAGTVLEQTSIGNALESLIKVHDVLLETFEAMVTAKGNEVWERA